MAWLEHRIPPPLVMVLFGIAMAGLAHVVPLPVIPLAPPLANVIAAVLMVAGSLPLLLGALFFQRARTTPTPLHPERASTLVTVGPYRYTRNPMYVGFALGLVGWAFHERALGACVGPPLYVAFLTRFQIVPEERALLEKFGPQYAKYRARVRRWF